MIAKGNTDEGRLAAGLHPGVCVMVASVGPQETKWGPKEQVVLGFELPLETWTSRDGANSGTKTKSIRENLGLGSPSMPTRLRRYLEAWRERPFSGDEAQAFDLSVLLGKPAGVVIAHNENARTGRIYEDVETLCRVSAWTNSAEATGREIPAATVPLVLYDFANHDEDAWKQLPEWVRALTPVFKERQQFAAASDSVREASAAPAEKVLPPVEEDEDLPF